MLEILVQSWLVLTASLLAVLTLVIGVQRALAAARQLVSGLRAGVTVPVAPTTPQLYAAPTRH